MRTVSHFLRRSIGRALLHVPSPQVVPANDDTLLIIVIAFNRPDLIARQAASIAQFGTGISLMVADNSTSPSSRTEIEKVCRSGAVGYVSLPWHPIVSASDSHGWALDWCYRHMALATGRQRFGFIDHDIFPTAPFGANDLLRGQPFYGLRQDRGEAWYLWPGFCFFDLAKLPTMALDFFPAKSKFGRLDTGGGNWNRLFSKTAETLQFASQVPPAAPTEFAEIIDGWGHVGAASNWKSMKQ